MTDQAISPLRQRMIEDMNDGASFRGEGPDGLHPSRQEHCYCLPGKAGGLPILFIHGKSPRSRLVGNGPCSKNAHDTCDRGR
jgi:hypothetical protein